MATANNSNLPFYLILAAVTLLFLYLLKPFFFPLFWAAIIGGIFQSLYRRIDRRLNRPSMSAAVVISLIVLLILLPAAIVGTVVFNESVRLYAAFKPGTEKFGIKFENLIGLITNHPYAALFNINEDLLVTKMAEIARGITNYIFVNLTALTQNTLGGLVQFAIMLYTLFFFIRDGEKFLGWAMRALPLGKGREKFLFERFFVTARSTLKVTLIIGGIQGTVGGIVFFIANIDGAVLWGLLMIIMAVVPVVGCSIIWAPAGLIMLLTGHLWEGILILVTGVFVISMIDNLLRPVLIGKDVEMHPLLIFLSTLGGIVVFGFSGFVIGPIIASLLLAIWAMHEQFFRQETVAGK